MSRDGILLPRSEGITSRQAHADLPANTFERELGREGFYGPATQMHHQHPPTGWSVIKGELLPRAFDTARIDQLTVSPWQATELLHNQYLRIRIWKTREAMQDLVRNADGDELMFIHAGTAELYCDYGHMSLVTGDYVYLPRGTMWRIEPDKAVSILMIESTGASYRLPEKGLVGRQALFDPAVLDTPKIDEAFIAQQTETEWKLVVKRRQSLTLITYPYNPLDAIGWHGDLMPLRINWRDFRPLMSHRYHLPPSAHSTFVSDRFVVCTFVPRPLESDPGVLRVPFYHNNDDYDEVIFYHHGQFFSRDNIQPGMMTLHPAGITHGPHPKAYREAKKQSRSDTDEVAVMIDARDPLEVGDIPPGIEWKEYVNSWKSDPK